VATIDALDFPRARRDRIGFQPLAGAGAAGGALAPPQVRLWSWYVAETTQNDRVTVASPRFRGPAVIDTIVIAHQGVTLGATIQKLQLMVSPTAAAQAANQAATLAPSGISVFEESFADGTGVTNDAAHVGLMYPAIINSNFELMLPVRRPVYDAEFFLNLSFIQRSATVARLSGYVRVVEQLAPEDVPNFL
jgi:hypothetical protein